MSQLRVLILHGWHGSGRDHWQTWLAGRLRDQGVDVRYPALPDCEQPCPERWAVTLHAELAALATDLPAGRERLVICHSLACVLWLREAAAVAEAGPVDRVALVAPPCAGAGVPQLAHFYPTGADAASVARAAGATRLVCSDDDPYCPGPGAAERWGRPLGIAVDVLPGTGHLNEDAGFGPWPEMEAWCLGTRDDVAAGYAGAKKGAEM